MNVLYFFHECTRFIRYFYENAVAPFHETKRKIEAKEEPFGDPPYSESGEPPYLEEWMEASDAAEVLGRSCITMLSASLNLYFGTWEKEFGIRWEPGERKHAFKKGYLEGYRICFEEVVGRSWSDCPADLELLEQMVLARNRDQHPEQITTMQVSHGDRDLTKYPRPVFMSDVERRMLGDPELEEGYWMNPAIHVSSEGLHAAITETEKLASWIEEHLVALRYGR